MNLKIDSENESKYGDCKVFIDETEVGIADKFGSPERVYHLHFNEIILDVAEEYDIENLFSFNVDSFELEIDILKYNNLSWINSEFSVFWCNYDLSCYVNLVPDFVQWNKPIDILTFIERLKLSLDQDFFTVEYGGNLIEEGFFVNFFVNPSQSITSEYSKYLSIIDSHISSIFENVIHGKNSNTLFSVFSFPPEIRQACEQYLLYFSKFLEDLGIEVSSKLNSTEKNTFFSIVPNNPDEALVNIRDLLNLYLELPKNDNIEYNSLNSDVSIQQLLSNIYHLKSQLLLSSSIIQLKDATIQNLEFLNYQQTQILESRASKSSKNEVTLDGLVTIKEFNGKGFNINLPEIFRRLKRRFK